MFPIRIRQVSTGIAIAAGRDFRRSHITLCPSAGPICRLNPRLQAQECWVQPLQTPVTAGPPCLHNIVTQSPSTSFRS